MERNECIAQIRASLKARRLPGDPLWSVKGGRGTAWGWIEIDAPPSARTWGCRLKAPGLPDWPENYEEFDTGQPGRTMSPALRARLGELLGLDGPAHCQGVSIPAGTDYRREYVARAAGHVPTVIGVPYWD
jgi:hypothetical protein